MNIQINSVKTKCQPCHMLSYKRKHMGKYFTQKELIASTEAYKRKIDNTPGEEEKEHLDELIELMVFNIYINYNRNKLLKYKNNKWITVCIQSPTEVMTPSE